MFSLIADYLKKRGIKDITELSADEKATFDKWENTLAEGEMTIEKILGFCKEQKKKIEAQYVNPDNSDKKDIYLKAALSFYATMIQIIESPKAEREALIKHLESLLK